MLFTTSLFRRRALNTALILVLHPDEMTFKDSLPRMSDACLGCTIHLPSRTKGTVCTYSQVTLPRKEQLVSPFTGGLSEFSTQASLNLRCLQFSQNFFLHFPPHLSVPKPNTRASSVLFLVCRNQHAPLFTFLRNLFLQRMFCGNVMNPHGVADYTPKVN